MKLQKKHWAIIIVRPIVLSIAVFLLPALFANTLYYKYVNKLVRQTQQLPFSPEKQISLLFDKGGTTSPLLFVLITFAMIFPFTGFSGILAAIAIPAYQDYTTRAKINNVLTLGKTASGLVAAYYYENNAVPASLEEAGFSLTEPQPEIQDIGLYENGVIFITMKNKPIEGKDLFFIPSFDANEKIVWTCASKDIRPQFLPIECRHEIPQ